MHRKEIQLSAFDNTSPQSAEKQYEAEAKKRWDETEAYKEYEQKTNGYSESKKQNVNDGMNEILKKFALCKNLGYSPSSENAQALVNELKTYITENFYTCTKEILANLGQMYVCDERFRSSINKHGESTAEFISEAVSNYCKN